MLFSVLSAAVFFSAAASSLTQDVVLGHGERIDGNRYVFRSDFSDEKVRDVPALVSGILVRRGPTSLVIALSMPTIK